MYAGKSTQAELLIVAVKGCQRLSFAFMGCTHLACLHVLPCHEVVLLVKHEVA